MNNKNIGYAKPELTVYEISVEDIMIISIPDKLTPEDDLLLPIDAQ